jgi:hypothetical protein
MRPISRVRLGIPGLVLVLTPLATCSSDNVIGPGNQLQVTNAPDDFQFQVSNLANVTQTLTYNWSNTGDSANVNQASSLTSGSATLTIRGPTGTVLYQSGLQSNGTFHTLKDATGTWQIQVVMRNADGALNFRVQKAP